MKIVDELLEFIDELKVYAYCDKHEGSCETCKYTSKCDKIIYTGNKEFEKHEI